jgi:lipoprotein signal peptidase
MTAFPVLVGSAWLVAVTVTFCAVFMVAGAVYNPFDRFPSGGVDQFTEVFVEPLTVAVICVLCVGVSVAFGGLMLMLTLSATS